METIHRFSALVAALILVAACESGTPSSPSAPASPTATAGLATATPAPAASVPTDSPSPSPVPLTSAILDLHALPGMDAMLDSLRSHGIADGPAGLVVLATDAGRTANVALVADRGLDFVPHWLPAVTFGGGPAVTIGGGTAGYAAIGWAEFDGRLVPTIWTSRDGVAWTDTGMTVGAGADRLLWFSPDGPWPILNEGSSYDASAGLTARYTTNDGVTWQRVEVDLPVASTAPAAGEVRWNPTHVVRVAGVPLPADITAPGFVLGTTEGTLVFTQLTTTATGAPCPMGGRVAGGTWTPFVDCRDRDDYGFAGVEAALPYAGGVLVVARASAFPYPLRVWFIGSPPADMAAVPAAAMVPPPASRFDPLALGLGSGPCPANPPTTVADAATDVATTARCFGGRDLTLSAILVGNKDVGCGGVFPPHEPLWLHPDYNAWMLVAPGTPADKLPICSGGLLVTASPVVLTGPTSWSLDPGTYPVSVTGHFDDPAAKTCRITDEYWGYTETVWGVEEDPLAQDVHDCRLVFVVTAIAQT